MDPPECQGHSHDHSDHGAEEGLGQSLRPQIDFPRVVCLNEAVPNSGQLVLKLHEDRLTDVPNLLSNPDDPELLLHIPFTEAVTIKSISIRGRSSTTNSNTNEEDGTSPPHTVKLFVNQTNLDFETARDMEEPTAKLVLLPPHHLPELSSSGTIDYPLRPAGRFQNVSSLDLFFPDNQHSAEVAMEDDNDDDDFLQTHITFIGLKGKSTKVRRHAVETVYESQGMLKDHKVKGADMGPIARTGL